MIKHLAPLFIALFAFADSNHYLLPDQYTLFERRISHAIARADTHVRILSSSLNHPNIRKSSLLAARRGIPLTLIVTDPKHDPLGMVAYSGVNLLTYSSRPLDGSLLLVDNTLVCTTTSPLDAQRMESHAITVQCSDDPPLILEAIASFEKIKNRSVPYLRP